MRYSTLGNTGLVVSRLAFGAMTFGQGTLVADLKTRIGQAQATRMVKAALDAGVNLFDTADMYTAGQSEVMLGKALGKRRPDAVIATKCGFRSGAGLNAAGLAYGYVLSSIEGSLKRLGTDYIDLYFLHIPDPFTPLEETARALDLAVRQGKVRHVGVSNYPAWQAQKLLGIQAARGYAPVSTMQMYYSLLGRDIEAEVAPFLQDAGLGLMVWSPLASGFLSGKYTKKNPVPKDARRAKFNFPPIDVDKGYAVVEALGRIARKRKAAVAQVALAWVLAKPFVTSVLVGANSGEQLAANLGAADLVLAPEEVASLDALTAPAPTYPAWMQPMGRDAAKAKALGLE